MAANLPSMGLPHLQLCSAVFSQYSGALLKPFSQARLMKTNASVKTSCALFSSPISPPSLSRAAPVLSIFLHLHILMPRLLSCSLSCCVGFIHLAGLRTLVTASLHVCVCVVVCQLICACVGWSVVSLLSMRHTSRHTCTHRGGGCCVRTEGAVGVLSELDLGFLFYSSQSGCYGMVEYCCCRWAYTCVWMSEGVDQNWKQHYDGSYTYSLHSLSELSFFCFLPMCFPVWGSRSSFSKELDLMLVLDNVQVSHTFSLPSQTLCDGTGVLFLQKVEFYITLQFWTIDYPASIFIHQPYSPTNAPASWNSINPSPLSLISSSHLWVAGPD